MFKLPPRFNATIEIPSAICIIALFAIAGFLLGGHVPWN